MHSTEANDRRRAVLICQHGYVKAKCLEYLRLTLRTRPWLRCYWSRTFRIPRAQSHSQRRTVERSTSELQNHTRRPRRRAGRSRCQPSLHYKNSTLCAALPRSTIVSCAHPCPRQQCDSFRTRPWIFRSCNCRWCSSGKCCRQPWSV